MIQSYQQNKYSTSRYMVQQVLLTSMHRTHLKLMLFEENILYYSLLNLLYCTLLSVSCMSVLLNLMCFHLFLYNSHYH